MILPRFHAVLLLLAGVAAPAVLGQRSPSAPITTSQPPGENPSDQQQIASLATKVGDLSLPLREREDAAARLVELSHLPNARSTIATLLEPPPGNPPDQSELPASVILHAVAQTPDAPSQLFSLIAPLAGPADARQLAEVTAALGSIRTPESAHLLLSIGASAKAELLRAATYASLSRLTGRDDLGRDAAAWKKFLDEAAAWNHAQWRDHLAHNLAARADRLADSRRAAASALTESLRRLHLATAPEARSELLASMLRDPVPEVRAVAFELISRELSAARRLDPVVGQTVVTLLRDPSPAVRENAAILVKQIAPTGVLSTIMEALLAETEPGPAAALLQAAARNPTPELLAPTLKWLESGAAPAAMDAAWSLFRAGHLNDAQSRTRVLNVLRSMPVRELTGPGCQLVASLGNDVDRRSLAVLLDTDSPALKIATADALVIYPEFLTNILAAAAAEPQLLDTATRGVIMERPNAAGFRAVAALSAPSDDARRRALLSIAAVMPGPELLAIARSYDGDLPFRESLLTLLASPDRILSEQADPAKKTALCEGLILLAETRLSLDRPDSAVAALDTLAALDHEFGGVKTASLRAMAMLCLNRIEDAQLLNAPASVWLDALEKCNKQPFASSIAAAIARRFAGALSAAEHARLASLTVDLPARPPRDFESEFVGPPAPVRQ